MRVIILESAQVEIAEIETWWSEHRTKAPMLFTEELEAAITQLRAHPLASVASDTVAGSRRVLLRRSNYHVYLFVDVDHVRITSVVGASQLGRPRR